VRYGVVFFAVTLAIITYIDRVCIMKSAGLIQEDLKINDFELGWVLGIFAWTYGLFEVPWGVLSDRIGAKKVLLRIVLCWSFFTAATGWAWSFPSLLLMRACFGAGEAGCFPSVAKTFTTWLTEDERVRAQGILWLSARWAGALTPLLVVFILGFISWRHTFELFGVLGVVWFYFFNRSYRDNPRDHPGVNPAELAILATPAFRGSDSPRVDWRKICGSPRVWLLSLQFFCLAYAAAFYQSWMTPYVKSLGLTGILGALLDGLPLYFMGLGSLFCGLFLSRMTAWTGSESRGRRLAALTGFLGSAALLFLSTRVPGAILALIVMGLAGFTNDLVMPASWAASMDIGGRYAGTVSAVMNMVGSAGAGLAGVLAPRIKEWGGGGWNSVLYVSSIVYLLGALCWLFLDPKTPLDQRSPASPQIRTPSSVVE
jgi:MFS family permease